MTVTTIVAHGGALDGWLERRRALGQDQRDEVWEGVYHVTPHASAEHGRLALRLLMGTSDQAARAGLEPLVEFNLGHEGDYRIPDFGWVRRGADLGVYVPSATIVGEVVSPGDATAEKVPFYLGRGVEEVWVVDPEARRVVVVRDGGEVGSSEVLGLSVAQLTALLGWV